MKFYEDFYDLVELVSVNENGAEFSVYYQNKHQTIFVPRKNIVDFDLVNSRDQNISYIMKIYKKWTFLSPKVWAVLPVKLSKERIDEIFSDVENRGIWEF